MERKEAPNLWTDLSRLRQEAALKLKEINGLNDSEINEFFRDLAHDGNFISALRHGYEPRHNDMGARKLPDGMTMRQARKYGITEADLEG